MIVRYCLILGEEKELYCFRPDKRCLEEKQKGRVWSTMSEVVLLVFCISCILSVFTFSWTSLWNVSSYFHSHCPCISLVFIEIQHLLFIQSFGPSVLSTYKLKEFKNSFNLHNTPMISVCVSKKSLPVELF